MVNSVDSSLKKRCFGSQDKLLRQLFQRFLNWFLIIKKDRSVFAEDLEEEPYLTRAEKALGFEAKDSKARQQASRAVFAKLRFVSTTEDPRSY